ncbi:MAG: hypothetical protein KIS66_06150 [Fimbriimonadaceae bacterium]|nr:hypothetical protein [Fimbriimonadaceae bacterium]
MIKLPFSSIAEAKADPAAFKKRLSSKQTGSPMRYGPNRLLQEVINRMHNDAMSFAQGRIDLSSRMAQRFPGHRRTAEILTWFEEYATDYSRLAHSHALGWTNVAVPLPADIENDIAVTGRVGRVDLVPDGTYAAWLMAINPGTWQLDPRMPLLQLAVADILGCSPEEVSVGVYCFKDGLHYVVPVSANDRAQAITDLRNLEKALR